MMHYIGSPPTLDSLPQLQECSAELETAFLLNHSPSILGLVY